MLRCFLCYRLRQYIVCGDGESVNFVAQERLKCWGPLFWSGALIVVIQSIEITHDKNCRESILFKYFHIFSGRTVKYTTALRARIV